MGDGVRRVVIANVSRTLIESPLTLALVCLRWGTAKAKTRATNQDKDE